LILPDSITEIGPSAFHGCKSLNGSLHLPSGISVIRNSSFCETSFTGDLIIPDNVTLIDNYAFFQSQCTGQINLSKNLISINLSAFASLKSFNADLVIPNSVQFIRNAAFRYTHIQHLTLPISLIQIGNVAFNNSILNGSLIIPPLITQIPIYAFAHCPGLSGELIFHANISIIGAYAFISCGIESFVVCNATSILPNAFKNCLKLISVIINSTLIDQSAFSSCPNLQIVDLNARNVTALCFSNITKIANLTIRSATKFQANSFQKTIVVHVIYYPTDFLELASPLFENRPKFTFVNGYNYSSFLGYDLRPESTELHTFQIIAISIGCMFFVLILVCVVCQIRSSTQKKEMAEQQLLHLAIMAGQPSLDDSIPCGIEDHGH
jgi:hypothetical protein